MIMRHPLNASSRYMIFGGRIVGITSARRYHHLLYGTRASKIRLSHGLSRDDLRIWSDSNLQHSGAASAWPPVCATLAERGRHHFGVIGALRGFAWLG